jgi:multidrug resistance efflux pump
MEAILLAIYSFFVWLIFIKLKWLPWNTKSQVTVVIIPIVGIAALILLLNVFAPSSADVRVINYVVQINPQVRGMVIEVPAEGNRPMKKGEVLFRIDPTPYRLQVEELQAQLTLAQTRLRQSRELAGTGAGNRFDVERYETESAQYQAKLANARWELDQTTVHAPADGTPINVQLRRGSMAVPLPVTPAMTFVENDHQIIALFQQNELQQVNPGDEAEVALKTLPGKVLKAKVDSIVWAQGQGQLTVSGMLPQTGVAPQPPGRFAVKLDLEEKDLGTFLAAGAVGDAAIYTQHLEAIHIIRKVVLRVGSYVNYLILKLH